MKNVLEYEDGEKWPTKPKPSEIRNVTLEEAAMLAETLKCETIYMGETIQDDVNPHEIARFIRALKD